VRLNVDDPPGLGDTPDRVHDAFLPSGALRDPGVATGLRDLVATLVDAMTGTTRPVTPLSR
jgi:hypothetical protein